MKKNINDYINMEIVQGLLKDLIKIPSPFFHEDEIMEYSYNWFRDKKLPVEIHTFFEDKITNYKGKNVIGRIIGRDEGPKVILNGHLDTVTICDGWTKDPLGAEIIGNRLYGLGALDMKGGSSAIMLAVNAFSKTVDEFNGEILYSLVSEEEGPFGLGTDYLILDGYYDNADVAIVPEPSAAFVEKEFPCLCLGARGGWSYTVTVRGEATHGAKPEKGINALIEASKIILELKKLELKPHSRLGAGSICISKFKGGGAPLTVPDKAVFTVFRHIVPGEDREYIRKEFERAVKNADIKGSYSLSFRESPHQDNAGFNPYIVSESNPYTRAIKDSIFNVTGKETEIGYFDSVGDFNYLGSRCKLPTYVLGPTGKNFHGADEYVELDSVVNTAKIIYDFLKNILI